jgi:NitT/TauT family transport system substrate-binding protein
MSSSVRANRQEAAGPAFQRRRTFLRGLAGATAFGVVGFRPTRVLAQSAPLQVGIVAGDAFSEAVFAQAAGFFERGRLDVNLVPLASSAAVGAALAGGTIDIGLANPIVIANARQRGLPFYAFAPSAEFDASAPSSMLMVAKKSALRSAPDLIGGTVGSIEIGGMTQLALRAWLNQNGVDPAKINFVELPYSAMAAALTSHRIDAGFMGEPSLTASRGITRELAIPYESIAKRWYLALWFSSQDWLSANGPRARRFSQIIFQAATWENMHRRETASMLRDYAHMSDDVVRHMQRSRYAEEYNATLLQPLLDAGVKFGSLQAPMSASELMRPLS